MKKLVVLCLLSTVCFGLLMPQLTVVADVVILYCMIFSNKNQGMFKLPMYFAAFFLICSFISCWYYEKQSIFLSLTNITTITFLPIFSYFYMIRQKRNIPVGTFEKFVKYSYLFVFVLFTIQYMALPIRLLNLATFIEQEKRFTIYGQSIMILGYFIFLNKYLLTNKKKYLIFLFPEIIVVFMQGFRSYLLAIVVTTLLFVLIVGGIKKCLKVTIPMTLLVISISFIPAVNNAINKMQERQKENNYSNRDYIRVRQFDYYTTEHFKDRIEYFFGSGFPNIKSTYGKRMDYYNQLSDNNGGLGPIAGWPDWGMVGLSWMLGIPFILCFLYCIGKILLTKLPRQFLYYKFFYLFILMISLSSVEFYRTGSVYIHGMIFYFFEQIIRQINNRRQLVNPTVNEYTCS